METAVRSAEIMEEMIAECRVIQAVHVAAYYMAREKHRETDTGRGKHLAADAGRVGTLGG